MSRLFCTAAAAAIVWTAGMSLPAQAAPFGAAIPQAADETSVIERVARCFYPNGWAGPGYYECGYRLRHGEGFYERREHEEREERHERRERRDFREDRREHEGHEHHEHY